MSNTFESTEVQFVQAVVLKRGDGIDSDDPGEAVDTVSAESAVQFDVPGNCFAFTIEGGRQELIDLLNRAVRDLGAQDG